MNLYSKSDICILDNLKGVAIILICLHHSISGIVAIGTILFLPIMIPIFAFASGFAFKGSDLLAYVQKISSVYILGNLIYLAGALAIMLSTSWKGPGFLEYKGFDAPLLIIGPNNAILWYLVALIFWGCCAKFIVRFKYPLISAIVLIMLFHYPLSLADFTGKHEQYWSWFIFQHAKLAIKMFWFFLLGVLIPWETIVRIRRSYFKYLGVLCSLPLMWFFRLPDYFPTHPNFWQAPLYLGVCTICTFTAIAIFPGFKIKFLTEIGKASLNIYLFHMLVCWAWRPFYHYERGQPHWYTLLMAGVTCLIIVLFCYLFSLRSVSLLLSAIIMRIEGFLFKKEDCAVGQQHAVGVRVIPQAQKRESVEKAL